MTIAAIDMGSNAIRLTLSKRPRNRDYHSPKDLIEKHRFPCRLGSDVFKSQTISGEKVQQLDHIFREIQEILEEQEVEKINAVATSAFRDAENGPQVLKSLSRKYKIPCRIITGKQEAKFMSQGLFNRDHFESGKAHLHVDIGGGSLELSLFHSKRFIFQKSLDVGTLRLLVDARTGQLVPNYSEQLKLIDKALNIKSIKDCYDQFYEDELVMHGTGGNFRRLGRLRRSCLDKRNESFLQRQEIPLLLGIIMNYSGFELSKHHPVKKENGALIVPSLLIIQRVLEYWPSPKIKIPKISLSHALVDQII